MIDDIEVPVVLDEDTEINVEISSDPEIKMEFAGTFIDKVKDVTYKGTSVVVDKVAVIPQQSKADVGLGNVDNTADADKPVSTPQQNALDSEESARASADTALGQRITAEESARESADSAIDASAVHKTGAESIAGNKTLTSAQIFFKNGNFDRAQSDFNNWVFDLFSYDKNSKLAGIIGGIYYGDDIYHLKIRNVRENDSGTQLKKEIDLVQLRDGTGYVTIPNRAYDANNTSDAVNIAMLEGKLAECVHLLNAETISGLKTFTNEIWETKSTPRIVLNNTKHTRGTAPSSNSNTQIYFKDAAGNVDASIISRYGTNQVERLALNTYGTYNGADVSISFYMDVNNLTGEKAAVISGQRDYSASNTNDIVTIGTLESRLLEGSTAFATISKVNCVTGTWTKMTHATTGTVKGASIFTFTANGVTVSKKGLYLVTLNVKSDAGPTGHGAVGKNSSIVMQCAFNSTFAQVNCVVECAAGDVINAWWYDTGSASGAYDPASYNGLNVLQVSLVRQL